VSDYRTLEVQRTHLQPNAWVFEDLSKAEGVGCLMHLHVGFHDEDLFDLGMA